MTQVQKQADIRYRVGIKAHPGIVVYLVKSSDGQEDYQVTFCNGKANNCTCKSRKPCYHMRDCQAREDGRKQVRDEARTRENNFALAMGF